MILKELAERLGGTLRGDGRTEITGAAPIEAAGPGQIAFMARPKYRPLLSTTRAAAVIVAAPPPETRVPVIVVPDPAVAFARALAILHPRRRPAPGVSPLAFVAAGAILGTDVSVLPFATIGEGARIGDRVEIHSGVHIGGDCRVGDDSILYANVSVYEGSVIGNRVIIHSGAVIGSDGFGFAWDGTNHVKIPQVGTVEIGDEVEIGANTTIDRGTMGATRIGRGTKIDNLVQIGHNVVVGENCILVSQAGISGSTRLGKRVTLAGQAGIGGHVSIGDNALVAGQAGVSADVPAGASVGGTLAFDHRKWLKALAVFQELPELRKRVRALEETVAALRQEKKQ